MTWMFRQSSRKTVHLYILGKSAQETLLSDAALYLASHLSILVLKVNGVGHGRILL